MSIVSPNFPNFMVVGDRRDCEVMGRGKGMADEEPESFIEQMTRETSLPLRAVGGRVFVQNADAENIDRGTIELKCWWSPGLLAMLDTDIRIGDHRHKPFKWDDDGVEVVDEDADVGFVALDDHGRLSPHL